MFNKIKNLQKSLVDVQNLIRAQGKEAISEAACEIFDKFPQMTSLNWKQYQVYCDGDGTQFTVGKLRVDMPSTDLAALWNEPEDTEFDEDFWDEVDGLEWHCERPLSSDAPEVKEMKSMLWNFSKVAFDTDFADLVFGTNIEITVTADGNITTKDYYNDY